MNKKLALFPMNRDMCAIARGAPLLEGYELSALTVPKFMRLDGEPISRIDGGNGYEGMPMSTYDEKLITECDTLFVDYNEYISNLSVYTDVIKAARGLSKKVILSRQMETKLNETEFKAPPAYDEIQENILNHINAPIITVLTHGKYTNQFTTELAVRRHFISQGYKVTQIGSWDGGQFFGFANLPDFLYEKRDAYDKILMFNRFVKELVDKEQPDLLIVGVPDAVMKYSDQELLGLGVLPFIMCSAVSSDASVLCTHYAIYIKEFFERMSRFCDYKLGCPVQFFGMANTLVEPDISSSVNKIKHMMIPGSLVTESMLDKMETDGFSVFNVFDNESTKKACAAIEEALVNNVRHMK
jgi:peptide maturation system protein (TIGR04066 family)